MTPPIIYGGGYSAKIPPLLQRQFFIIRHYYYTLTRAGLRGNTYSHRDTAITRWPSFGLRHAEYARLTRSLSNDFKYSVSS